MKHTSVILVASLLGAASLVGCKMTSTDQSNKKSIDAVATGDQSLRSNVACGPGSMANSNVSEAVVRSYVALPPFLQMQYPDLNQSFRISEQPAKDCLISFKGMPAAGMSTAEQGFMKGDRLDALKACWVAPVPAPGETQEPRILMGATLQDVHNSMIVTSFYAFAEWYMDRVFGPAIAAAGSTQGKDLGTKGEDLIAFVAEFSSARKAIAAAVIADLEKAGKADVIAKYEQDFSAPAASLSANVGFQNFVSAEFTDTWYCSVETHESLVNSTVFPKTREAYAGTAKLLGKAWFEN